MAAIALIAIIASTTSYRSSPAPVPPRTNHSYLFFMKAPTEAHPVGGFRWHQDSPSGFTVASMEAVLQALNITPTQATDPKRDVHVGFTFQWEMLDCFLSPHTCTTNQTIIGITNFLNAAKQLKIPVAITLDPQQFWYQTGLWNWFNSTQPGYDSNNVHNVEWIGWEPENATMIAWRDWGSQFRMPTPQPNIASPALLKQIQSVLRTVVQGIRTWYEAQTPDIQQLLVAVKIGEEVDIGANYYYYEDGNQFLKNHSDPKNDPKYGLKPAKGLSGGLPAMGYNMLKTLGIRSSGGPPTRQEITKGVQNYFQSAIEACIEAWPLMGEQEMLFAHAGFVSDPLLIEWQSPAVWPAIPTYSFYMGVNNTPGQPGLATMLNSYDPDYKRFSAGEFNCFGCSTPEAWNGTFSALYNNGHGLLRYASFYNVGSLASSSAGIEGLHRFLQL
eukprot:m.62274 g.62274  ORF g.62274 m.62274 type:complete len:443 (+) comp11500_c0_seq4:168-1496(+)